MDRIKGVKRLTENRFLNLYELDARQRDGKAITYYVASRAKGTENLKSVSGHRRADGVIMLSHTTMNSHFVASLRILSVRLLSLCWLMSTLPLRNSRSS